ncbi:imidazole glycerol phosphate synthase subunit HisH [Campylobacter sp. CCUG 57310]|uniref:imidazole glycerol phosphate synthase subunit HisH n=1 Tax=Campylobacter sp. CCUG 57310 TaxID=2517362 RepID=UPI0015671621|nr:imidazole glycerol phosphate synthase subunit HisH [Campylobacter sp. CCUG 57310]QKF91729.1 imidazole glycerol phosphate synthase HisFH, HisH subunit [Campylobacter sp. CCUG 57310]
MSSNIGIIDYGAGNLQSVVNAFKFVGFEAKLVKNADELAKFDKAVLPGVGAFGLAINRLKELSMDEAIKEFVKSGKPFLGICLGMQLLFDESDEFGVSKGLGLISGRVKKFNEAEFKTPLKIPHIGWNGLNFTRQTALNANLGASEYLYFVHSYHVVCEPKFVLATSEYGYEFISAVCADNIYGFQPHPEKSSDAGLKILRNFGRL